MMAYLKKIDVYSFLERDRIEKNIMIVLTNKLPHLEMHMASFIINLTLICQFLVVSRNMVGAMNLYFHKHFSVADPKGNLSPNFVRKILLISCKILAQMNK